MKEYYLAYDNDNMNDNPNSNVNILKVILYA